MVQIFTCATCGGPIFANSSLEQASCPRCAAGADSDAQSYNAPVVATLVPQVDPLKAKLAAEEARWRQERIRYCIRDKYGLYPEPSPISGFVGGFIGCMFGSFFLFRGLSRFESVEGQWYFTIAGVIFVGGGLWQACREVYNWANYSIAEGDYQARRHAILAKYQLNARED